MPHFTKQQIRRQNIVTLLVIAILIVSGLIAHGWFNHELLPVDADDQTRRMVVIPKGTTDKQAGTLLKKTETGSQCLCIRLLSADAQDAGH